MNFQQQMEVKLQELRAKQNHNNGNQTFTPITWYKIKQGRNVVRILPPYDGGDYNFYAESLIHQNVNCDGRKRGVTCSQNNLCPICGAIKELQQGNEKEQAIAKSMRAKPRYYFNVIDQTLEPNDPLYQKVQVMSTGVMIFEEILSIIIDPDFNDITHPDNGRDVIINRSGEGLETEYHVNARPCISKVSPIILADMVDLAILTKARDPKDIEYLVQNGEYPKRNQ